MEPRIKEIEENFNDQLELAAGSEEDLDEGVEMEIGKADVNQLELKKKAPKKPRSEKQIAHFARLQKANAERWAGSKKGGAKAKKKETVVDDMEEYDESPKAVARPRGRPKKTVKKPPRVVYESESSSEEEVVAVVKRRKAKKKKPKAPPPVIYDDELSDEYEDETAEEPVVSFDVQPQLWII